jgi:hypothetical protein
MKRRKLEPPKPRVATVVIRDGKRPPVDLSLIPPVAGETIRLGFRADTVTCSDIQAHLDRITSRAPGVAIAMSDAVRSLIQRGAAAFEEDDRTKQEDK